MRDEKLDNYLRDRGWKVRRLPEQAIRDHERGRDGGAMQRQLGEFIAKSRGSENGSQAVRQACNCPNRDPEGKHTRAKEIEALGAFLTTR